MTGRLGKPLSLGGPTHNGRCSKIVLADGREVLPRAGGARMTKREVAATDRRRKKRIKRRVRQATKRAAVRAAAVA